MNLVLPVGLRTVSVRAFGWEDESITIYVASDSVQNLVFTMKPAVFRLRSVSLNREYFNPLNAGNLGTTELNFEVSSPGSGFLVIERIGGETVFSRDLGPFDTWAQSVRWDGRDRFGNILPDDVYFITLKVRSLQDSSIEVIDYLQVHIDSSRVIRPLTIFSGKSGLLFTPLPDLLPERAFQFEGGILFGNPPSAGSASGAAWTSLPFAAAFRFSPLPFLEIAAALDVLPVFNSEAFLGIGGSVKWTLINPSRSGQISSFIPGLALCTVISLAEKTSVTPFGMGSGIEVNLPVSAGFRGFSVHLAPALFWTGDEGFPWEGMPRFLLSGGLMFSVSSLSAGISARSEYRYLWNDSRFASPSLMLGGEIKFFPPPSNLVFTVMGGVWLKNSATGGFGGIGIGMIY